MTRALALVLLLAGCHNGSPSPSALSPTSILSSPLSYVAQFDHDQVWPFERADASDNQHVSAFFLDSTHAALVWSYAPFARFDPTHGDGGETYELRPDGSVYITATQDGSRPGITPLVEWWAFDDKVPDCQSGWRVSPQGNARACHMVVSLPPFSDDTVIAEHYDGPGLTGPLERSWFMRGVGRVVWQAYGQTQCRPLTPADTPPLPAFNGPSPCDTRVNIVVQPSATALSGATFGWPPVN